MHPSCQLCHALPATTHLTEIRPDGGRDEVHICATCIAKHQLDLTAAPPSVATLLAFKDALPEADDAVEAAADDPACASCGLVFSAYAANNILGCADCYTAFAEPFALLVARYHEASTHVGRGPANAASASPVTKTRKRTSKRGVPAINTAERRQELEVLLLSAVTEERFEDAATLRDQLRQLDGSSSSKSGDSA